MDEFDSGGDSTSRRDSARAARQKVSATRRNFLSGALVSGAALGAVAVARPSSDGLVGTGTLPNGTSTPPGHAVPIELAALQSGTASARSYANVLDFGAVGDGRADDTAAIDQAVASTGAVFFPPGDFLYNGAGLPADREGAALTVLGAGRNVSTVRLGDGKSLVTQKSGVVASLQVSGLTVVGGYGAIRLESTDASVGLPLLIWNNSFLDYTGAAISSLHADQPYWHVEGNAFKARDDGATFGVVLMGNNNQSVIESNAFMLNGCHIKLGGTGGAECRIEKNDFIRFAPYSDHPRTDLWIDTSGSDGFVGGALTVAHNKFGNENVDGRDFRVLFADAGAAGPDPALRTPDVKSKGKATVSDAVFDGNNLAGASSHGTCPFVYTTARISGLAVRDLILGGTPPPFIVQFAHDPGQDPGATTTVVGPLLGRDFMLYGDWSSFRYSNYPGNVIGVDDSGRMQDPDGAMANPGAGDPVGLRRLTVAPVSSGGTVQAQMTPMKDAHGGPDAGTFNFASSNSSVYFPIDPDDLVPGQCIFVEFDARPVQGSSLTALRVVMSKDGVARWGRSANLSAGRSWRRYRFVYLPQSGADSNQFMLGPANKQDGPVALGRVRVYAAAEPLNIDGREPGMVIAPGGLATKVTKGTPSDDDLKTVVDGALVVDASSNKLWVRVGESWRSVDLS